MENREEPMLRVVKGTKVYGGAQAISGVDFDIGRGEIHGLVGENGAGKSTLCKALAGAISLSSGDILFDGQKQSFATPADALRAGIVMVYQETSLIPTMTVAQNIILGREKYMTRLRGMYIAAQQLLQSMNFHVDPTAMVSTLGAAQKQMVEIARAVHHRARLIIFDEPTATLTPEEKLHFFDLIRRLKAEGVAIIFISHALEEALELTDRVTVLRDGERVHSGPTTELSREILVKHMVGRDLSQTYYADARKPQAHGTRRKKVLSVQNVIMGKMVRNMSFSVYAGEITGISGLIGSGRTEIAKVVSGVLKRNFIYGGMIYLNGKPIRYRIPRQAVADGIVYITEDRKLNGFFETMRIDENIYLGRISTPEGRTMLLSRKEQSRVGNEWVQRMKVRAINSRAKIIELSGGNQQKVVVAKSLVQNPKVVFFDEPTRGVDVGAIQEIHDFIRSLAAQGIAVVVISSYLPEILSLSDRILVARQGRIVEEFSSAEATEEKIMYAAIH
ncbi:sugar ABC transporter ATP-binding protein [Mesorhizobium sp. BH1-1-5]|uniref:sugar ABC transporter ATP-binding protein n=2 Tax=unclassified Mesorhizobium TaxID=325217 RepID=UPI001128452B|nr:MULTISPECIES: sugar ABC transporter ATP-binding protein [unclassified Mesorhizobium]MBZ9988991.1 sugar ABC transporter ATP-binding protein [Mesorhizobium sp. BH1-1-5]TPJ72936.1 sugar ABC transporter ATP-binding protein [Mesorhizobium sp. B2-7-1]